MTIIQREVSRQSKEQTIELWDQADIRFQIGICYRQVFAYDGIFIRQRRGNERG